MSPHLNRLQPPYKGKTFRRFCSFVPSVARTVFPLRVSSRAAPVDPAPRSTSRRNTNGGAPTACIATVDKCLYRPWGSGPLQNKRWRRCVAGVHRSALDELFARVDWLPANECVLTLVTWMLGRGSPPAGSLAVAAGGCGYYTPWLLHWELHFPIGNLTSLRLHPRMSAPCSLRLSRASRAFR